MVVARIDRVQAGGIEERLHERGGLGARGGIALLGEWDVCVQARVVWTGDVWVGLCLEVGECGGRYMDECKGWEGPVLVLVRGSATDGYCYVNCQGVERTV